MARLKEDLVFEALIGLGGTATPEQVAKRLGWPSDIGGLRTLGHIMSRLIGRGKVKRHVNRILYEISCSVYDQSLK